MTAQAIADFIVASGGEVVLPKDLTAWASIITSLCFVIAIFFTRKIIYYISQIERDKRLTQKRILNTIISTEEKERRRFSKDLHDGLGPLLSSIKLSISALKKNPSTKTYDTIIDNAMIAIEESIKSLKETSNNLSPHILNNFGIHRAITNFVNMLSLPKKLKVKFTSNINTTRYSPNIEAITYRMVCELVNNAIKHAHGTMITVNITSSDDGSLNITVSDNGKGFDVDMYEQDTKQGMGLYNISSRVSSLKGNMTINSIEKLGTIINIKIDGISI